MWQISNRQFYSIGFNYFNYFYPTHFHLHLFFPLSLSLSLAVVVSFLVALRSSWSSCCCSACRLRSAWPRRLLRRRPRPAASQLRAL